MADKRPSFVFKDVNLFIDQHTRIGQCSELAIPVFEEKLEEMRNAGMIKPREIAMGYEATRVSFKETAFDPRILKLYGVRPGSETPMIGYGYLEDEDGTEHDARVEMVNRISKLDFGNLSSGEKGEISYDVVNHSGALFIDEEELLRWDDFDMWVGGNRRQPGRQRALRMV